MYIHVPLTFLHIFQNYTSIVFVWAIMAAIYEWAAADPIDVRPILYVPLYFINVIINTYF